MNKIKRTFGFILSHPLVKRRPLTALSRFLCWQLQSRIWPDRFMVKPFVPPLKFYARKGLAGITGNIYTGLHEFSDMGFLLHFLRAEDVFFDVGANAGTFTLLASGICKAMSVAIEPVSSTFDLLTQNVALNKLQDRVTAINSAAGAVAGNLNFSSDEDTTNHVIAEGETAVGSVIVSVVTIDSLAERTAPTLIKIDVEGFETEVVKGMTKTLESPDLKSIIMELSGEGVRYGFNENAIDALLRSKGFLSFSYDPFTRLLTEASPFGSNNTIYCRDLPVINKRLKNAEAISVLNEMI